MRIIIDQIDYIQLLGLPTKVAMTKEAQVLVKTSFGDTLLHTIGEVYEQQAEIALSNFFGAIGARFKASTGNVKWALWGSVGAT